MSDDKRMFFIRNMEELEKEGDPNKAWVWEYEVIVDSYFKGAFEYGPYRLEKWGFGDEIMGQKKSLWLKVPLSMPTDGKESKKTPTKNGYRGFNNEVQHLGKREGFRYSEDVCTKDTNNLDWRSVR